MAVCCVSVFLPVYGRHQDHLFVWFFFISSNTIQKLIYSFFSSVCYGFKYFAITSYYCIRKAACLVLLCFYSEACSLGSFLTITQTQHIIWKVPPSAYYGLWKTPCFLPLLAALFFLAFLAILCIQVCVFQVDPFFRYPCKQCLQECLLSLCLFWS